MEEKTDLELWADDLKAIYDDLRKRLDLHAWSQLLSSDICQALDTRFLAEETLLEFFKTNYHVPHDVMVYLNDQFGFTEHMDDLREKFPPEFLEYAIAARIRNEENFPLALFTPGIDGKAADIYEITYRKVYNTNPDEAAPLIERLENSSEKHPYGEALLLKLRIGKGDLSAVEGLEKLCEQYPEDNHLAADLMMGYEKNGRMDLVEKLADECLQRNPDLMIARRYKADAAAARGDYREAVDIIQCMMQELTGEQKSYYELDAQRREWNDAMMEQMKERLAADPSDFQSLYDLMWCFIQNDRTDEAQELIGDLPFEKPDPFSYYNVKSVLASEAKHPEEALEFTRQLLVAVDRLKPDGTKKTEDRIGRRSEVIGRISNLLFELGQKEEALEMAEQTIQGEDSDLPSLFNVLSMQMEAKNYERASEIAEIIIKRENGNSGAYYLKALANFKMLRDNVAFDAVNSAIDMDGSSLPFYILKLRILVRNHAYDAANELIDFLVQNGITDDPTVDYCRIYMFANPDESEQAQTQEDFDKILALAASLDERLNSGEYDKSDWISHFYYLYSVIMADRQDFDKSYPVEPLIEILDKGLSKDPDYYSCLSYKAWLLKKDGKTDEALQLYKRLEQVPNHNVSVEENLGSIYYGMLQEHAEDDLRYYSFLIEKNPENPDWYFYAGMCHFRMENPKEAAECFALEQQYGPDDIDGYYRMAYALLKLNRLEEAVEMGKKTVELAKKRVDEKNTVRFWNPLILAYRRMKDADGAIAAINDCAEQNPDWDSRERTFKVLLQMGRLEEARKLVEKWRHNHKRGEHNGWTNAHTDLLMLERKPMKLNYFTTDYQQYIDRRKKYNADMMVAAMQGKPKRYLSWEELYYGGKVKEGTASTYDKAGYAWALFVGGKLERAQELAAEALQEEDEDIKKATGMVLIHKARRIRLLAILGFEIEAREAIAETRTCPLCETCEYCSCKDVDLYYAQMEFILGNYDKAMEMAVEFEKKWPDEADFIELQYLINAKGKKK